MLETSTTPPTPRPWPLGARVLASVALGVHLLAMLSVALSGAPASPLEQRFSSLFSPYIDAIDQGHVHRYYAPAPPPTPIALAEIRFGDDKPPQTIRIPDRSVRPRIRYQRQLALAYHLFEEVQSRPRPGDDHRLAPAPTASPPPTLTTSPPRIPGVRRSCSASSNT